ncbi:hypothetical protein MYU51_005539 [Penicillium brevicompactum]
MFAIYEDHDGGMEHSNEFDWPLCDAIPVMEFSGVCLSDEIVWKVRTITHGVKPRLWPKKWPRDFNSAGDIVPDPHPVARHCNFHSSRWNRISSHLPFNRHSLRRDTWLLDFSDSTERISDKKTKEVRGNRIQDHTESLVRRQSCLGAHMSMLRRHRLHICIALTFRESTNYILRFGRAWRDTLDARPQTVYCHRHTKQRPLPTLDGTYTEVASCPNVRREAAMKVGIRKIEAEHTTAFLFTATCAKHYLLMIQRSNNPIMAKYLQTIKFEENNALPRQITDKAANRDAATSGMQHTNTAMCMLVALTAHEESFISVMEIFNETCIELVVWTRHRFLRKDIPAVLITSPHDPFLRDNQGMSATRLYSDEKLGSLPPRLLEGTGSHDEWREKTFDVIVRTELMCHLHWETMEFALTVGLWCIVTATTAPPPPPIPTPSTVVFAAWGLA